MFHQLFGQYNRIIVQPLEHKHIEELRVLRNKERKWFVYSEEISSTSQEIWFNKYISTMNDYMFAVFQKSQPENFIGAVAIYNVDTNKKTAEFGRIIIDKNKVTECGLGYDTTVCVCNIGFEALNLERIFLEVIPNNVKAIKTYEKSGFVRCSNIDTDLISMELLKKEA